MTAANAPDLGPTALPWLVAAMLFLWLALRVWILRNRLALREPGEEPPRAAGWLLALARARWTLPLLLLGILAAIAGVVLVAR